MTSPRAYECFVCKRQGVGGVQVYLDGKDTEGRTKYLNDDMTTHIHQGNTTSTQLLNAPQQTSKEDVIPLLRIINAKLDRLLSRISGNSEKEHEGSLGDGFLIE